MQNFSTNDKVICIDDRNPDPRFDYPNGLIKRDQIYCVSGLGMKGGLQLIGFPALCLDIDLGWRADRFRKVNKTGGQISQLIVKINGIDYPVKTVTHIRNETF